MSEIQPTDPTPATDSTEAPPPAPRKRRRRWPWMILGLLIALVLLVILLPTIASTGPVRSFAVGQINNKLNGTVQIADWSLGWTSGINVGGVKVYDEQKVLVLEVDHLKTDLTLLNAARGNYQLGETLIDVNLT